MWFKNNDDLKKPETDGAKATRKKDPDFIQLSTLQLIKILLVDKFLRRKQDNYTFDHGSHGRLIIEQPDPAPNDDKVYHLAIVVDEEVKDIMRTHERLARILTSDVQFVAFDPEVDHVHVHTIYRDGDFINQQDKQ